MKTLTALVVIMGMSVVSGSAFAACVGNRNALKGDNYALSRQHDSWRECFGRSRGSPQVRGYVFRPGGHAYDYEYDTFLSRNGPYGNYPGFDPRDFKERVFSDPRFNTTSPSAF